MTAALAAAAIVSLLALKVAPVPWAWACGAWAVALFASAVKARATALKVALVAAGCVASVLCAGEVIIGRVVGPDVVTQLDPDPMYRPDSLLGWRLFPGTIHAVEHTGTSLVYDVRYGIDSLGHRVTPPPGRGGAGEPCVLFLTDSYTFGLGLPDEQTLPWLVAARLQGRLRAINLGTPAYGAEHMLARLERGDLGRDVPCHPVRIIYQAMPHHVLRSAGRTSFSRFGPRYVLAADGTPRYAGTTPRRMQPGGSWLARFAGEQLDKSSLYTKLIKNRQGAPDDDDYRLYFAIVARVRDLFAARYPGAEFHVLLWIHREYAAGGARLRTGFDSLHLRWHLVNDILPGFGTDQLRYMLDPRDLHPNARANALLAAFVADSIVGPDAAARGKAAP